jgi:hypothetical protein
MPSTGLRRATRIGHADFDAMPVRDRNAARWIMLDESARSLSADGWEKVASLFVGTLRMDAAQHPDDTRTAELVGELSMKSAAPTTARRPPTPIRGPSGRRNTAG